MIPFICVKGREEGHFGEPNCYCPLPCCEVPPGLAIPPQGHAHTFQIPIAEGCNRHCCGWCCFGCCCLPCAACVVRRRALGGNLANYTCCQGYFQHCCCCGITPGSCCEETCPTCCLCLEAYCCHPCSMAATRMYIMDKYGLISEATDYGCIRSNNAFAAANLVASIALGASESLAFIPNVISAAGVIVYGCTVGGMTFEMVNEMQYQAENGNIESDSPKYEVMNGRLV